MAWPDVRWSTPIVTGLGATLSFGRFFKCMSAIFSWVYLPLGVIYDKLSFIVGGRHSTAVAFKLRTQAARVRFSALDIFSRKKCRDFSRKKCWDSMTAALLSWWTVPRLNSHSNPSSTGESSAAKKEDISFLFPLVFLLSLVFTTNG